MPIFKTLFCALAATLLLKIASVVPALLLADIIDDLSQHGKSSSILLWLFVGLIAIQALLLPAQAWCLARLCQDRVRILSARWCSELLNKRFEAYENLHGGMLVKVLDRGITAQERWLNFLIGSAWPVLIEAVVLAGLFLYFGAGSVLLGLIPLSMLYLWFNGLLVRWRRPHIETVNAREDELAEQWVDTFASAVSVKLECAQEAAMKPVTHTLRGYADASVLVATSGGWLHALKIAFIGAGSGGLLAWGMLDQMRTPPSLTLGELVALFTLVGGLLAGVAQLAEGWRMLDQFRVDRQTLQRWLKLPNFGASPSCSYPSQKAEKELSLAPCTLHGEKGVRIQLTAPLIIRPGEHVALAGPSGSGKSTLLSALAGTVHSLRHHLQVDGTAIDQLDATLQFSQLRLCPQKPRFLPGQFPRAVLFDQAHEPTRIVDCLTRLRMGPEWYEREIDGRGESISGGEARRLSLLRVLNRPGDYNFFDEPTSGLDGELAIDTWDLLFERLDGRGLICVTHDMAALGRFDRVLWVEDGLVTEAKLTMPSI